MIAIIIILSIICALETLIIYFARIDIKKYAEDKHNNFKQNYEWETARIHRVMKDLNMRVVRKLSYSIYSDEIIVYLPHDVSDEDIDAANARVREKGMRVVELRRFAKYNCPAEWHEKRMPKRENAFAVFTVSNAILYLPINSIQEISDSFAGLICLLKNRFHSTHYDNGVRYSIMSPKELERYRKEQYELKASKPYDADEEFDEESKQIAREIEERVRILQSKGLSEALLNKILKGATANLSRLIVTADKRLLLIDYKREVEMTPLPKAVFLLFLRHEEGIRFKDMQDYKQELTEIYRSIAPEVSTRVMEESIDRLTDPTDNSINEKCARIREAFLREICPELAQNYFVTGKRATPKRIIIDRAYVFFE